MPVPPPLPLAGDSPTPEYAPSPALSMSAHPGHAGIATLRVALAVAAGVDARTVREVYAALLHDGAQPRLVGAHLGAVRAGDGCELEVEVSFEATPAVLYDALVLPDGPGAGERLARDGRVLEFVRDQYRHGKPILAAGSGAAILDAAGIPTELPNGEPDPGVLVAAPGQLEAALHAFVAVLARHKVAARETDPPRV
jgi:catalase